MNGSMQDNRKSLVIGSRAENFVSKSILLEEAEPPRIIRMTVWLTVGVLIGFLVWSFFAQLDVVAVAKGVVTPQQSVQVIQHVDGGRIAQIEVRDGDVVKKGQLLVKLNDTEASSEYETLTARYWVLRTTVERLRALLSNRRADFSKVPKQFAELAKEQEMTLRFARIQMSQLEEEIKILKEVAQIRADLEKDKLVSRVQVLETQKNLNFAEAELMRFQRTNLDSLNTSAAELSQVESQMVKLRDRLDRVDIVSPVDGVVQDLKYKTIGGVIPPSAPIMQVVPMGGELEGDVQVSTNDIGFVREGQVARLKFGTYDFMRYGTVEGTVKMVSPYSTVDDKGVPYFKVVISIPKAYLGDDPKDKPVEPGMTLDADIITDRQSVLRYLLRPVYFAFRQGMRER